MISLDERGRQATRITIESDVRVASCCRGRVEPRTPEVPSSSRSGRRSVVCLSDRTTEVYGASITPQRGRCPPRGMRTLYWLSKSVRGAQQRACCSVRCVWLAMQSAGAQHTLSHRHVPIDRHIVAVKLYALRCWLRVASRTQQTCGAPQQNSIASNVSRWTAGPLGDTGDTGGKSEFPYRQ